MKNISRSKHRASAIQKHPHHRSEIFSCSAAVNGRVPDNIPTLKINPKPAIPAKARQGLQARQQEQKVFFDKCTKPYKQDFKKADIVKAQIKGKWIEGKIHDKHRTRSYWINTVSDQAIYTRSTRFIRHNKIAGSTSSGKQHLVHSDNDKLNPNSHLNKDKLTQSKHSGSPTPPLL
ncbi:hypothetical protein PoB_005609000 [Plakobranchus ocellatus]|uniref:Uncharacterized protein n=1 Tax=Plakobranchus ocellatus TaxID=259542 RepID=A0AAV4CD56_9GAST|nr:hypothetical protein PoB_005609000 [Plakobranchus ocellatus]